MARITTEGCMQAVEDRFELVVLAIHLARKMQQEDNDCGNKHEKNTVLSLRKIANNPSIIQELRESFKSSLRKVGITSSADTNELAGNDELVSESDDQQDYYEDTSTPAQYNSEEYELEVVE